ncbi:MAG: toxin-antitoxin system HicB family antitoxin [Fusobacterium sp.]|mgnify:CR=1 FL=1|nr:toxin-antitoxin system HicB family antitoxin [Fusobacterium sp.]
MGQITIRLKDEDEKKLKIEAEKNNLSLAEFCRKLLLEQKNYNEENTNNLDDINNKILKVNTNVIKSHNILDSNLSKIEMQINTLLYFILLLINLFKPESYEKAKTILNKAKNSAKMEWEANKK